MSTKITSASAEGPQKTPNSTPKEGDPPAGSAPGGCSPPELPQLPAAALPDRLWDAVVVGAGPAGSAAAAELASRGYEVVLLDEKAFPREKVCGEGLLSDAVAALQRLGAWEAVREAGHTLKKLSVFSPSRFEVEAKSEYLTLRRARLDELLARHAASRGALFAEGRAVGVVPEGEGVRVAVLGPDRVELRARATVLATGPRLGLLKQLGMAPPEWRPEALAVRCRVRSPVALERLVASYDASILPGYAWIFPLGGGDYNLGCGFFRGGFRRDLPNLATAFGIFVREFPLARELVEEGEVVTPLAGAPLRCGLRTPGNARRGPVLAAGEAIGATLPFTGEGIGKALETGELAAKALDAALKAGDLDLLELYPRALRKELGRKYLGYRVAERWLSSPRLADYLARRVRASRHLRRAAMGILLGASDPREIFSLRGIVRSLFS
ncbi:MAG: geranylgeranyl reductase family protein [Deltaproteobacteria bacterium]|nr:geranylgeranyl reductase family protein [Deltaproteobacteria bacterium]